MISFLVTFSHSLSIFSQPGWQAGTTCAALHLRLVRIALLMSSALFWSTHINRRSTIFSLIPFLLSTSELPESNSRASGASELGLLTTNKCYSSNVNLTGDPSRDVATNVLTHKRGTRGIQREIQEFVGEVWEHRQSGGILASIQCVALSLLRSGGV